MKKKSFIGAAASFGLLLSALAIPATLAADGDAAADPCTVSADITGQQITEIASQCSNVIFAESATVNGPATINRAGEGVTFIVTEGKTVTFQSEGEGQRPILSVNSDFTFENLGTVNFGPTTGRGISVTNREAGKGDVSLVGGTFNFDNVGGYSFESERGSGSLTVDAAKINITLTQNQVEGAFNTGQNFGTVTFNHKSIVNIDDQRDNDTFRRTAAAHNVIYTENDRWEFLNESKIVSNANVYYNISLARGTDLKVDGGSSVTVVTKESALLRKPSSVFGIPISIPHPQVGINTSTGTRVEISNGGKVEVVDNTPADPDNPAHGIEVDGSEYVVNGGTLITPSAGPDHDNPLESPSNGKIKIDGNSTVSIPAIDLPNNVKVEIEGGTVVLPPNTTGVTNFNDVPIKEFVSTPQPAAPSNIQVTGDDFTSYTYEIPENPSADGNYHVWAPPVEVYYHEDKSTAVARDKDSAIDKRVLISGTSVENPYNGVTPVAGTWKIPDNDEVFQQTGPTAKLVTSELHVYRGQEPSSPSTPVVPEILPNPNQPSVQPESPANPGTPVNPETDGNVDNPATDGNTTPSATPTVPVVSHDPTVVNPGNSDGKVTDKVTAVAKKPQLAETGSQTIEAGFMTLALLGIGALVLANKRRFSTR